MRNWLRLFSAVALVCLLGLYPILAPPAHRIDQAHADLIVQGMTKEQVEAIFGVPAGEYDWAELNSPSQAASSHQHDLDQSAWIVLSAIRSRRTHRTALAALVESVLEQLTRGVHASLQTNIVGPADRFDHIFLSAPGPDAPPH
jgi:hypothetical protein